MNAMSIVILGVGGANFGAMEQLDGDDNKLKNSDGVSCHRDIVQFVPMRNYTDLTLLSKEVLHEIPNQMIQFYKSQGMLK